MHGRQVFIIKNGQIFTPPIAAGALRGITRRSCSKSRTNSACQLTEADITRYDIFTADECFLTGTAAEVIPVVKLDGRVIGDGKPGPITTRIIARFRELTRDDRHADLFVKQTGASGAEGADKPVESF